MTPAEAARHVIESPDRIVSIVVSHHEKPATYMAAVRRWLVKNGFDFYMAFERPVVNNRNILYIVKDMSVKPTH
jgi:hypothetical protein